MADAHLRRVSEAFRDLYLNSVMSAFLHVTNDGVVSGCVKLSIDDSVAVKLISDLFCKRFRCSRILFRLSDGNVRFARGVIHSVQINNDGRFRKAVEYVSELVVPGLPILVPV